MVNLPAPSGLDDDRQEATAARTFRPWSERSRAALRGLKLGIRNQPRFFAHFFFAALVVAVLLSAVAIASQPKGNDGKGRYYFRQTCKECHTKGAKGGEITPLSKTQAQWRMYFLKAKHASAAEPLTKVMADTQLLDVQTYLINHAADSLQPETCGK